jgi:hypothetical protein
VNPAAIAVIPNHSGFLVTNNGAGTVSVMRGSSVLAPIPIPGGMPDGVAITPDSLHACVTNFDNQAPNVSVHRHPIEKGDRDLAGRQLSRDGSHRTRVHSQIGTRTNTVCAKSRWATPAGDSFR